MQRIVHLDLKGAPLKVPYLEKVISAVKQWGATGVLLEWEDTFPYNNELVGIGSLGGSGGDGMYSQQEVEHILRFTKENGLKAIQLVQTIGHMEFVLKHPEYKGLREEPRSPGSLCPSQQDSQRLVRGMLQQVLDIQPDAEYIHIGADEVWHAGVCVECQKRATASEHKTVSLYLDHVRDLAIFLKQQRPALTVLMWDDVLRSISFDTLRAYKLGDLVEPVLWDYNPMETFRVDPHVWGSYRELFPTVWAGSAYKGANGSCQMVSPVKRYVSNHEAWIREMRKNSNVNFGGVILTGWSRYDHYATLCELLTVSLPSLASCLRILQRPNDRPESLVMEVLPSKEWPGEDLARYIHSYVDLRARCLAFIHGDLIYTWMNPWQLANNYTNPVQVQGITMTAQQYLTELEAVRTKITANLHGVTGPRSSEEWMDTYVTPVANRLTEIRDTAAARAEMDASTIVKPSVV